MLRRIPELVISAILVWPLCQGYAKADPILDSIKSIEQELNARVGFYKHDLHTREKTAYQADYKFALSSTFKLFACGALLTLVDKGESSLAELVDIRDFQIEPYSPAINEYVSTERFHVTLGEACGMMLSVSDNTAANIVLAEIGGPKGFTAFMRSIGDGVTRLDRWETELNEALPGDPRDTTTPRAIGESLESLLLGDVLTESSRADLRLWLSRNRVADDLFRAALPSSWSIEDRTGAGGHGSRAIVAIVYPPQRKPIVAAFFMGDTTADLARRNGAIARLGEAIVESVASD